MKNLAGIILVFSLFLLIVPSIALFGDGSELLDDSSEASEPKITTAEFCAPKSYKMLITQTGEIIEIPHRDYIIGAVFAQMPASFEKETLKAQAVLANTYALRQHLKEISSPDESLKGADFSDDTRVYQAYFTPKQAESLYGENYTLYFTKISLATDEVINEIAVFEGEPIISAFHSMSGGITESATVAWGADIPYLKAVESDGDKKAPGFYEETVFGANEVKARLSQSYPDIVLGEDKASWMTVSGVSESGTVLTVDAGSISVTGKEIKEIFSLRSCFYEISFDETTGFKFIVRGCGHGVGLSQYGANTMAKDGSTYSDILYNYFDGIEITKLNTD